MALSIKNQEVEALVEEVSRLAGESKTQAVKTALRLRLERLKLHGGRSVGAMRFRHYLESEIWPSIQPEILGRPVTPEEEELLGFGREAE